MLKSGEKGYIAVAADILGQGMFVWRPGLTQDEYI